MARIEKDTSRYANTGEVDFYLDLWNEVTLEASANDTVTRIESKYHLRPDKMSFDLYGTPRYWWIFAIANPNELIDPINDFKSGLEILVPSKERLESSLI